MLVNEQERNTKLAFTFTLLCCTTFSISITIIVSTINTSVVIHNITSVCSSSTIITEMI